jgi:hypothetical protein
MWWLDAADSRMSVAKSHGEEMRAEAEASRLASSTLCPGEVQIAVSGRHLHLGSLVIVFGRTLREEHCTDSVRA